MWGGASALSQWACGPRSVMKPKVGQAVSPVVGTKGGNVLHRQDLLSLPPWYRAGVSTVPPTFRSARTTDPTPVHDARPMGQNSHNPSWQIVNPDITDPLPLAQYASGILYRHHAIGLPSHVYPTAGDAKYISFAPEQLFVCHSSRHMP